MIDKTYCDEFVSCIYLKERNKLGCTYLKKEL